MWRRVTWLWVQASSKARSVIRKFWYFSTKRNRRLPAFRHPKDQGDHGGFVGFQRDRPPQRDDGVEDRSVGVGKRTGRQQGRRRGRRSAAPDEPAAVGFAGHPALPAALAHHDIEQPRRPLLRRSRAAGAENGGSGTHEFRLHEQVAEGGMGRVRSLRREHHLGIARQLDHAHRRRVVGELDAPQLHVVLGRNADLGVGLQPRLILAKLRPGLGEDRLLALRRPQGGLMRGGPEIACRGVSQVDKRPPAIARGVLAPSCHGQIAPAAVAPAGAADDDMIPAVGQQVDLRRRGRGIGYDAHSALRLA